MQPLMKNLAYYDGKIDLIENMTVPLSSPCPMGKYLPRVKSIKKSGAKKRQIHPYFIYFHLYIFYKKGSFSLAQRVHAPIIL